jgi:hypothetical protein
VTPLKRIWRILRLLPFVGGLLAIPAEQVLIGWQSRYRLLAWLSTASGLAVQKRTPPLIVSLTTYEARISKVHLCIESLLRQDLKPDAIILWLANDIPRELISSSLRRQERRGLQIRFSVDLRSFMKIVPTLKEYPDAAIVTCDDDMIYPHDWLDRLYGAYVEEPHYIHCHRAHLITRRSHGQIADYGDWEYLAPGVEGPSSLLFPTGVGGVLYPPGSLAEECTDDETFLALCPTQDDVWLKAMAVKQGTLAKKVAPDSREFETIRGTQKQALSYINTGEDGQNDAQVRAVFERYGLDFV